MNIRLPARIGAFACLGVALAMAILALREQPEPVPPSAIISTDLPKDPLEAMLERCQLAGQAAGSDPGCLAAWAENRRRFLSLDPQPANAATDEELIGKSIEPAEVPAEASQQQEQ